MQGIASWVNTVLFLFIWTSSIKLCQCGSNVDCDFNESYDVVETVRVEEPVYVTGYTWCWKIRCEDNKIEYHAVYKNKTVTKTRTVKRCCKDQIQLYDNCIPKCNEDQCPNIQCAPDSTKCKCKPGFKGYLCNQKCDVGFWGMTCKNTCNKACLDCDHRTGCCKTPIIDNRVIEMGLTLCTTSKIDSQIFVPLNITEEKRNHENNFTTGSKHQSITEDIGVQVAIVSSSSPPPPLTKRPQEEGLNRRDTKVEEVVYKYDEMVKKLIWISALTVIAIAIIFVIMFVMFIKCNERSKMENQIKNRQSMSATFNKFNEICISTQNLEHVPQDRYTKAPTLYTSSNDGLPIQPDIFRPVFSAPHYTNVPSLYDSPQPLYEILC